MSDIDEGPKLLMDKISKIDKIEERQQYHAKEIKELKDKLSSNELDGRLTKVEKRQEFVLDELKDLKKEIHAIEEKCDKQRTTCMASVAPLSLVSEAKSEIARAMERFERIVIEIKNEFKGLYESSNRWNRWSLILSMVAVLIACFTMIISILQHFPKG